MSERWAHVKRAADIAFGKHVITAQMNHCGFTRSVQLLEMTITEFPFRVLLVAHSLRIGNPLWDCRRCRGAGT